MSSGCTDTVAARITASDDQYFFSFCRDKRILGKCLSRQNPVLLCQHLHGKIDTFQFPARNVQIACFRCTGADGICIEAGRQLFQINFGICLETDTLFFHNVQAAVDDRFVQLEIGDSEAQQAAGIFTLFEYGDCISLPVQLVGSCPVLQGPNR